MKKSLKKLSLRRETLQSLGVNEARQAAGADNKPPETIVLPPTGGAFTCTCYSQECPSFNGYQCN